MASGTGNIDVIQAAREILILDPLLSAMGVFYGNAPRADDVPFHLLFIASNVGTKKLGNSDALRTITMQSKSVAAAGGGREAVDIAGEMQGKAYDLLIGKVAGVDAKTRWNTALNPLGWSALTPQEVGEIGPYSDTVVELERWHIGHRIEVRIARI